MKGFDQGKSVGRRTGNGTKRKRIAEKTCHEAAQLAKKDAESKAPATAGQEGLIEELVRIVDGG